MSECARKSPIDSYFGPKRFGTAASCSVRDRSLPCAHIVTRLAWEFLRLGSDGRAATGGDGALGGESRGRLQINARELADLQMFVPSCALHGVAQPLGKDPRGR